MLNDADCRMEVVCSKKWEHLLTTEEEGIKFCGDCKQLVFYTRTPAELRLAAKRGFCVYIAPESTVNSKRDSRLASHPEITRERIRAIQAKPLRSLKGPTLGVAIIR
jgi:hypothetical protein